MDAVQNLTIDETENLFNKNQLQNCDFVVNELITETGDALQNLNIKQEFDDVIMEQSLDSKSEYIDLEKYRKRREANGRLWTKASAYVMDRPVNVGIGTMVRIEASLYHGNVVFHSVLESQKYPLSQEFRNRDKLNKIFERQRKKIYHNMPREIGDQEL